MIVPVRLAAVEVPQTIVVAQLPGRERLARPPTHLGVGCQSCDRASHQHRSLGVGEVGVLLDGVTPILLADTKVVEHGF